MMPEGPEIRTVVDQLQGCIGQRLLKIQFVSGRYYQHNNDNNNHDNDNVVLSSESNTGNTTGTYPDGYLTFQSTITPYDHHQRRQQPNDSPPSLSPATSTTTRTTDHVDVITDCNCKGKFMYLSLDNGSISSRRTTSIHNTTTSPDASLDNDATSNYQRSIWITFGMTGRFLSERVVRQYQLDEKECHIRWYIELLSLGTGSDSSSPPLPQRITRIYYSDMRGFGTLKFSTSRLQLVEKLHSLGPDLLQTCSEQEFISILQKQKPNLNICRFLMDQSKVCGVGNYILAEGLYRANIDPFATVSEIINRQESQNLPKTLYEALRSVIQESYESQKDGNNINKEYEFQCYGQTICKRYGQPVRKDVNGPHGRTIWYIDQQLFMTRQERRNLVLQGTSSSSVSTPTDHIELPTPAIDNSKQSANTGIIEETYGDFNEEPRTTIAKAAKSIATSVATAATPGNLKLAAILANSEKKKKSIIKANGMELDDTAIVTESIDTTKLVTKLLNGITEPGWKDALHDTLRLSDSFTKLALFLHEEEMAGKTVYPPPNEIFTALNLCPIDTVKVVILGQDPYHRYGQGHGLAFSVRKSIRPPPSLQNIFKELIDDIGLDGETIRHGNLSGWAKRGVLLLNTVLTVREGEAFSHANKGWEDVTNTILRVICERNSVPAASTSDGMQISRGLVFLLWGNAAIQTFENSKPWQPDPIHNLHIIKTSHPSPLGATKTKSPFLGSKCFSRANKALIDMGYDPVDWSIE